MINVENAYSFIPLFCIPHFNASRYCLDNNYHTVPANSLKYGFTWIQVTVTYCITLPKTVICTLTK